MGTEKNLYAGQVLYCTTCGTQTAGAGATGHNYSSVSVMAPTSSSKGYTRHRCGCGAYYDDTFTYKVEYDANGGYGNVASQTINYDKSENLKQNSFGRSYYHFTDGIQRQTEAEKRIRQDNS